MPRSTYTLSVPQSLYDAVAEAIDQGFADSYLYGAQLQGNTLTPRTLIGYRKMQDRADWRDLAGKLGIVLAKPPPFCLSEDRWTGKMARQDMDLR